MGHRAENWLRLFARAGNYSILTVAYTDQFLPAQYEVDPSSWIGAHPGKKSPNELR